MIHQNPITDLELTAPAHPILDAHVHMWDIQRIRYPWLERFPSLNLSFGLEELRRATEGLPVTSMVFVQCDTAPEDSELEVEWVEQLAQQDARLQACVAWAPLELGASVGPYLERLSGHTIVRGVRRIVQSEPDPEFCLRPQFIAGLRCMEEFGWSFDLCIDHRQLASAITLVEQVQEIPIILDHMGKPAIRAGQFEPWATQIRTLAGFPQVVCKISGVATEADPLNWTPVQLRPFIECALEAFGFDRVLFGGDWPISTQAIGYGRWIALLQNILAGVDGAECRKFWHLNAARVYRVPASSDVQASRMPAR